MRRSLFLVVAAGVTLGCSGAPAVTPSDGKRVVVLDGDSGCMPDEPKPAPASLVVRARGAEEDKAPESKGEVESDGFPFPDDRGGILLRTSLRPSERMPPLSRARAPKHRPVPASLESPHLPLTPALVDARRMPMQNPRDVLQPRLVMEEAVFDLPLEPALPQMLIFFVGEKTKEASIDVNLPPLGAVAP